MKAAALVVTALTLVANPAHAASWFQFEAGIGATQYQTEDGRWYQQGMTMSSVSARDVAFSAGVTGPLVARGRWGIDWHAGYVNLGRAAATCMCTPNDENYDAATHTYNPVKPAPLAYFTGSGRSQGFVLSLEPFYWWRGVRFGIEAGAYVNHADWQEGVYGWAPAYGVETQTLAVSTSAWRVAPVAGISVGNGVWSIGCRHYFTSIQHYASPPLWRDIDVLQVQYKF